MALFGKAWVHPGESLMVHACRHSSIRRQGKSCGQMRPTTDCRFFCPAPRRAGCCASCTTQTAATGSGPSNSEAAGAIPCGSRTKVKALRDWSATPDARSEENLMRITIQYFDGCPHWTLADERVRSVLSGPGQKRRESGSSLDQLPGSRRAGSIPGFANHPHRWARSLHK